VGTERQHKESPASAGLRTCGALLNEGKRDLPSRHHNNCPRCPIIGAEDIPGDEFYEILLSASTSALRGNSAAAMHRIS
jgi:hypothetical protein